MKIRALIFDFDGLLVNTSELITAAYMQFMERRGKKFDVKDRSDMMGRPGIVNMNFLKEEYGLEGDPEELLKERRAISRALIEERMALLEGVTELLELAENLGLVCAVGSGADRPHVEYGLNKMGIRKYFSAILTSDDLVKSQGKPDPEIFLLAAEAIGMKPAECIVLEDAPNGITAAKKAGMKSIFVPDARFTQTTHEDADAILKTLRGVTDELIKKLSS